MNIRKFLTVSALAAAAMVLASEARAQVPPLPVIKPICPQPICVQPIYRPVTLSTTTVTPVCVPVPHPAPKPAPRPTTPPRPIVR
jgi:hypothetical protein